MSGFSTTYGVGAQTDREWIEAVCGAVTHAVPTTLLLPGIGTLPEHERSCRRPGASTFRPGPGRPEPVVSSAEQGAGDLQGQAQFQCAACGGG